VAQHTYKTNTYSVVFHKVAKTSTAIVAVMEIFMTIFTFGFIKNSIFILAKFNTKIPLKMPMIVTMTILASATLGGTAHI
jgi:hypothetical protein